MKVLFLCYRGNPFCGGQGIYLYHLTRELAVLGVEIDVLVGPPYPDDMDSWATVYRMENLNLYFSKTRSIAYEKLKRIFSFWNFTDYILTRFHAFPEMETFSLRSFFFLKRLLKKKSYDIIHDVQCLGWGLVPMKGYGIPIISTVHHPLTKDMEADLSTESDLWGYFTTFMFYPINMQRFVINRLDRIITSSLEGVGELTDAFNLDTAKISVVVNGIDTNAFTYTGQVREKNALLFVGNTEDRKKGIKYLIEALEMLPENITLTIVDKGPPEKCSVYNLINKKGLLHRVMFTGHIPHEKLLNLYRTKTLLVVPSLHEGFGLPAAEAMSCEMPVVSTNAGALKETIGTDGAGVLVQPGDPAALKQAILQVLHSREKNTRMGKTGRKRVLEKFAWPHTAHKTLEVYKEVIEKYRNTK